MISNTKVFFPNLDGFRFICFLIVFCNHSIDCLGLFIDWSPKYAIIDENFFLNGDLAISFFFVLSGFLITYLLLHEKKMTGKINIKNYYVRRVLRIWPLYFLIIIITMYFIPMLSNHMPENFPMNTSMENVNVWLYLGFLGNFSVLFNGIDNVLVGVLWTVSIEEQFYLIWPLIIAFVPTKYLLKTFLALIFGSIAFRYFYAHGDFMIARFHTLSATSDLTSGALIALLATKEMFINRIKIMPKSTIIIIYIVGFIFFPLRFFIMNPENHLVLLSSILPVVYSAFFAFIIFEQNYADNSFYKIGNNVLTILIV